MASDRAYARAKHKFVPQTGSEIPLEVGDILLIISKEDSGWWKGKVICTQKSNVGLTGYFPGSYTVSASSPKGKLKASSGKETSIDEHDEKVLIAFNATNNVQLKEDQEIIDKGCSELSQTMKAVPRAPIKITCQSNTVGPVQSRKSNSRTNGEVLFVINSSEKDSKSRTM